jgi:GTPase SAR1 family protein
MAVGNGSEPYFGEYTDVAPDQDLLGGSTYVSVHRNQLGPILDAFDAIKWQLPNNVELDVPGICVIGDQSSGKTSLLENICRIQLPRGDGRAVTRCPLRLQLRQGNQSAVLSYKSPKGGADKVTVIQHLQDISQAVLDAQDEIAGKNLGISHEVINLAVTAPNLPDLTLYDLPGITRVPVGQQPPDIEAQIKRLYRNCLKGASTVILCVIPATADFSTCDVINIARELDPEGKRTLGVVTKVDLPGLANLGAKIRAEGKDDVKLRLGMIPVVNRTQEELRHNVPIEAVQQRAKAFFEMHPELSQLLPERRGTEALVNTLVQVQRRTLAEQLPRIKAELNSMITERQNRLIKLPRAFANEEEALLYVTGQLNHLTNLLSSICAGNYTVLEDRQDDEQLHVPPRMAALMKLLEAKLNEIRDPEKFTTQEFIRKVENGLKEVVGVHMSNFPSGALFDALYVGTVWPQFAEPCQIIASMAHSYVESVLHALVDITFQDSPRLQMRVQEEVDAFLFGQLQEAQQHITASLEDQRRPMTWAQEYTDQVDKLGQVNFSAAETVKAAVASLLGQLPFPAIQAMAEKMHQDANMARWQYSMATYAQLTARIVMYSTSAAVQRRLVKDVPDRLRAALMASMLSGSMRQNTDSDSIEGQKPSLKALLENPEIEAKRQIVLKELNDLGAAAKRLSFV